MIHTRGLIIVGAILLFIAGLIEKSSLYIMVGACTIIAEALTEN